MRTLLLIIFSIYSTLIVSATNYYVAPTGNNTNIGTISRPFKSINYGITKLKAGDFLYIRGGTYHEKVTVEISGTAENRIIISGYQVENAIIDGEYSLPGGSVYSFLVSITGNYVTFRDLTIKHSSGGLLFLGGVYTYAINIIGNGSHETGLVAVGNYDLFDGCSMTDNGNGYGINGQTTWGSAFGIRGNNITIQNCISYNNKGEGFNAYAGSKGVIIQDNISYDNEAVQFYIDSSTGIILRRNIAYCTVREGYNPGWGIVIGGETGEPSDLQIVNNLCFGNRTNLVSDSNVEYANNWIIAFNTFVNAKKTPVQVSNGDNMGVYFNPNLVIFTNSIFKNNIVIEESNNQVPINTTLRNPHSGFTFSNNCWNKTPVKSAQGTRDVMGDPLISKTGSTSAGQLTGDYFKLLSSSPAINKGEIINIIMDDFFGNSRDALPDIGAHEFYAVEPFVKIMKIKVTGSNDSMIIANGASLQLNAVVSPSNATNKEIIWSVTNGTGQAVISTSGLITAISPSIVTVTAMAQDGSGVFGTLGITIVPITEALNEMLIYPNPAHTYFFISAQEPGWLPASIKIANLSGKIILEDKIYTHIKELRIPIGFVNGIYIVQLSSERLIYETQKLIIQN